MMSDMVQIALVADLHGNYPATLALDADLKRRGIAHIYCLGDMIGKGPTSDKTMDWARENCEVILQGNWDSGISMREFPKMDGFYYDQLGDERMAWLRALPLEHTITLSGRKIRLFHGRPTMEKLLYIQDDAQALEALFLPDYQVVCYADAHRQGMRLVTNAGHLINTGSVGNGFGVPMVQYVILSGSFADKKAPFDVSLITLPYDTAQAVTDVRNAPALPHGDLFEREILTGIYARQVPKDEQDKRKA